MITEIKTRLIKPEPAHTPQCEAEVEPPTHNQMWRRDRYKLLRPEFDPNRCQRESVVIIGGKKLCRLHGGKIALDKWISGELVEKG